MPGMTVGGDESVWRGLSTALNHARQVGDEDHRLLGAHPVFYAAEQVGERWLLLGESSLTPQQARDELAHQFLLRAADADDDSLEQHDYRAAADMLDSERHDQMTTAGRHFQIVRAAQFLLMGPNGPEAPADGPSPPGANPGSPPELRFPGDADSDTSATTAALKAHRRHLRPGPRKPSRRRAPRPDRLPTGDSPGRLVRHRRARRTRLAPVMAHRAPHPRRGTRLPDLLLPRIRPLSANMPPHWKTRARSNWPPTATPPPRWNATTLMKSPLSDAGSASPRSTG
jgi:hypothetical protein